MKVIISKILTIFFLVNIFMPSSAFAADTITLYNRGEIVELVYDIELYEDNPYIAFDDLGALELDVYQDSDSFTVIKGERELVAYSESNSYTFNGQVLLGNDPIRSFNDIPYISIELIKTYFSSEYSYENNIINLYIEPYGENFVKGTICLPDGEIAENDMEVTVFVGQMATVNSGGGYGGNSSYPTSMAKIADVGYSGETKPTYDSLVKTYTQTTSGGKTYKSNAETTVTIAQGNNSASFIIKGTDDEIYDSRYIGYKMTDSSKYEKIYVDKFRSDLETHLVTIQKTYLTEITGMVTIPVASQSDINYAIVADGTDDHIVHGIIFAGETTSSYTIKVEYGNEYSFFAIINSDKFKIKSAAQTVSILESGNETIDFTLEEPNKIDVTLTVPEGYNVPNGTVAKLYLQEASSPHYFLDEREFVFGEDTMVSLYDSIGCEEYICYYTIGDELIGLNGYGHYTSTATTAKVQFAEEFSSVNNNIEIPLMKKKTIEVTVKLPNGELAASDIRGKVYAQAVFPPIDEETSESAAYSLLTSTSSDSSSDIASGGTSSGSPSGGSGGGGGSIAPSLPVEVVHPIIIEAGQNSGKLEVSYPDDANYKNVLVVYNDYFYKHTEFYVQPNVTSLYFANASYIENENLEVILMGKNKISGKITSDLPGFEPIITVYEKDYFTAETGYKFEQCATYDVDTGEYYVYVPTEITEYIVECQTNRVMYYSNGTLTENFNNAEIINATSDVSNIDFSYVGYNPPQPITVSMRRYVYTKPMLNLELTNISDYTKKNVSCKVALYDDGRRLQDIYVANDVDVTANSSCEVEIEIPEEKLDSATVAKIFVWGENLQPLSSVRYLKRGTIVDNEEYRGYNLWIQEGLDYGYINGVKYNIDPVPITINNEMMAGRQIADMLKADSLIKSGNTIKAKIDGKVLEMTIDSDVIIVNDIEQKLNVPPMYIDDELYMPLQGLCDILEIDYVFDSETGTFEITDSIYKLNIAAAKDGLITANIAGLNKFNLITKEQCAELLVNMYEKIDGKEINVTENFQYTDTKEEAPHKLHQLGILNGFKDGSFGVGYTLSVSEVVTVIWRTLSSLGIELPNDLTSVNEFENVEETHWAYEYIYSLKQVGIYDDIYQHTFPADESITIREFIALIENSYQYCLK